MADQAAEEQLLDVRIAEASAGYKFYLNNEKLILGSTAVILFLLTWETVGNWSGMINPMFMSAPSMVGKAAWQLIYKRDRVCLGLFPLYHFRCSVRHCDRLV